jgi:pSer/pThr/pTyr-binding forkhead associated (FHA) protein
MRAPAGSKSARLEVVHGPADVLGKVFTLAPARPATIGRDPTAEVTVPSDRVSRRHCRLEPQGAGTWMLVDLGSSNGTLVNQVRLQRPQALQGGEYIQAGDCLFRFVVG